MMMIDLY